MLTILVIYQIIFFSLLITAFLFYASYNIRMGIYLKALCKNPSKGRVVALTFDDGPDPQYTPRVLDVLKEHNIKACFFCIGSKIKGNEDLLERIKREGHIVGNHSYSHLFSFPLHTSEWIKRDLQMCDFELESNEFRLFRPPFGVTNPMIASAVKQMEYTTIGWNIRSLDTCRSKERVIKRIKKRLKDGSAILLHDRLPQSEEILREVIELINQENFRTVRIDELFDLKPQ